MKPNCWEILECGRAGHGGAPGEACPAALDESADGLNGGTNAGRICWTIAGTFCFGHKQTTVTSKSFLCQMCTFFHRVRREEGAGFRPIRLPAPTGTTEGAARQIEWFRRTTTDLARLLTVWQDVMRRPAIEDMLRGMVEQACHGCDAERGTVSLLDPAEHRLVAASVAGRGVAGFAVPIADGTIAGYVVKHDRAVNIFDTTKGPTYIIPAPPMARSLDRQYGFPVRTLLAVPIYGGRPAEGGEDAGAPAGRRIAGVIEIFNKRGGDFTEYDEWFLTEVAAIAGLALQSARLSLDLREVRRTDRAKSRFVALLMHQIISPLSTVYTCVSALAKLGDRISPSEGSSLVHGALSKVLIVQELAKKLLDLAAIQSGRALADIADVNVLEVVRGEADNHKEQAAAKDIRLRIELPPGAPKVRADPTGVAVILANLLANAIKYSDPGTDIVVSGREENGAFFIGVSDQGPGISSEDVPRLFDEFFRCAEAARRGVAGSGLGLTFVKTLVSRYGGSIHVESEPGKGSTFTVSFPSA